MFLGSLENQEALDFLSCLQFQEVLKVNPRQEFRMGHGLKVILTFFRTKLSHGIIPGEPGSPTSPETPTSPLPPLIPGKPTSPTGPTFPFIPTKSRKRPSNQVTFWVVCFSFREGELEGEATGSGKGARSNEEIKGHGNCLHI